jgi:3-phosphoshikimate 1-carboxyvinyltransferase
MQRACAAALLAKGTTVIRYPGSSNDDRAALDVIAKLGAEVKKLSNGDLEIQSKGVQPVSDTINCGESGLGIRMFTPLAALSERAITINGTGSLVNRPMDFFDEILPKLSIEVQSNNGKLPLKIKGPLQPKDITIDGSLSSQFLTGLLMAYADAGASGVAIHVNDLKSKPYIDLTLYLLDLFGVKVENRNYESFYFSGNGKLEPRSYSVEADWSGGAFILVAGAIAGDILVKGLDINSTQADKEILTALKRSGAKLSVTHDGIETGPAKLNAFEFDATDCPDLFPPLVSLAAVCDGVTTIHGVSRLAHKESNRGITLQEEFAKMGVRIDLDGDIMRVTGVSSLKGGVVHSRHDHRIAMACAVAALRADAPVIIEEAEAINKSYPSFFEQLLELGVAVSYNSQPLNQQR